MKSLTAIQVGAGWFAENPGGLDRYFHDLIEALPEVGVQCRGLVVGTPAVDAETDGAVRAFALPDESMFKRWRSVRQAVQRIVKSLPADQSRVLVTHFAMYAYPLIKDHDGLPWVVHFHGPWADEAISQGGGKLAGWLKRRLERSVYRHADRVIVLSDAFRNLLCETYGIDPKRVTVIPGGVDLDRFEAAVSTNRETARKQFGWPTDRPIVLTVRRLVPRMGLDALIDAMKIVQAKVPNALCLIAGRGPLAEALVQKIDAAGLNDTVSPIGFVPDEDLPLAYRAADVTIMPSETLEGFGLSAAESLAAGTPVLVTPVGGLPEVVSDLDPKLVLPEATASAIGAGLAQALANPSSLPSADACRAYAAKTFDWQVIAARIAAVYAEAAKATEPLAAR